MHKRIFLIAAAAFLSLAMAAQVRVTSPGTELLLDAQAGKELKVIYFGARLADADLLSVSAAGTCGCNAYPAYGMQCPSEAALGVTHSDGSLATELLVETVSQSIENGAQITRVRLKDTVYPFYVTICWRAYQDVDMIETWTEIENLEKKPVTLTRFDSGFLPVRRGEVWLSHLTGTWANEGRLVQEPLNAGVKLIKNKDGVRNSHTSHAEVMFSLDGKPQENTGRVIGAALCYSGNYELRIDTGDTDWHQFFAGINPDNSSYTLAPKEVFRTPELALTWSDEGLSGASRNFHKWARSHKMAHGDRLRKILLNSWEGVYFDINEAGMDQMMSDIASMGGELFVMDDGWFGVKYPRITDNCALGDWQVDPKKLPAGVPGLVECAKKHGIKFGIWIEPEMSNTVSELYELYIRYHSNVKRTTAYWRILFKERLQKDKLSTYLIERVKPSDAQEWVLRMKDSGLSYGTIDNAKRALKAAFTMAVQNDYLRKNPFDLMLGVPPPSRSPTIAVLLFPHKLYRL